MNFHNLRKYIINCVFFYICKQKQGYCYTHSSAILTPSECLRSMQRDEFNLYWNNTLHGQEMVSERVFRGLLSSIDYIWQDATVRGNQFGNAAVSLL